MIIETQTNQGVSSNIQGRTVSATVDPMQIGMLMDMLARNYNFPMLAILREYTSNAYDSHVQAGVTRPVEITLPSAFSSVLKVQDFGVGLSSAEVENIYSVFGASTKRDDNTNIGGFGIGAKSALSVSDQFTVSSVKNGYRSVFVVTRVNGGIDYKFVMENVPTDDANGVTVTIPFASDAAYTEEDLSRVLNGWKRDEVKVLNGPDFPRIADDWIELESGWVNPDAFTRASSKVGYNYGIRPSLMVGPVAYKVPSLNAAMTGSLYLDGNRTVNSILNSDYFALKLGIGSVTFPSSREVLEDSESNAKAIVEAAKVFSGELRSFVADKAANAATLREAVDLNGSFVTSHNMFDMEVEFEGKVVPRSVRLDHENSMLIGSGTYRIINFSTPFSIIENDIDSSNDTVKRTLADFRRFQLAKDNEGKFLAVADFQASKAVYSVHSSEVSDVMVELAGNIDKFSEVREVVLAARRLEAKRAREAKKADAANGVPVEANKTNLSGIGQRNVFVTLPNSQNHSETKIQYVMDKYGSDWKVYISRVDSTPVYEIRKAVENYENTIFVSVAKNISETSFQKYAEALNAEIISEDFSIKVAETLAAKLKKSDDFETMKKVLKSQLSTYQANRMGNDIHPEIYETFKKVEDSSDARLMVTLLRVEAVSARFGELVGLTFDEINNGEPFALMGMIGYYSALSGPRIAQLAAYMNEQWETHFQN